MLSFPYDADVFRVTSKYRKDEKQYHMLLKKKRFYFTFLRILTYPFSLALYDWGLYYHDSRSVNRRWIVEIYDSFIFWLINEIVELNQLKCLWNLISSVLI